MELTAEILAEIYPQAIKRIPKFLNPLREAMGVYGIMGAPVMAMFLAQIGHESGQLRYVEELASGAAYEGRLDLGNIQPGDGVRFKGRGLIQITGRTNYACFSHDYYGDTRLLEHPEMLADLGPACASAGWFWKKHKLGPLSLDIMACTKKINGGYNGIEDRKAIWLRAKAALGVEG